jgi:hypothetical protein
MKFYEEPSGGSHTVSRGRMDDTLEAQSLLAQQFCETAQRHAVPKLAAKTNGETEVN